MKCAAVLLLGAIVLFAHLDSSKANKKPADQQPTLSDSETAGSSDANPGIESDINRLALLEGGGSSILDKDNDGKMEKIVVFRNI